MPFHSSLTGAELHDPKAHASGHTDGTDDVQSATTSQKGLMTTTQAGKLNDIASGADVTSSNETSHADVLVDGDIGVTVAAALGSNDNYVTDSQLTVIGNTSGANTGDNAGVTAVTGTSPVVSSGGDTPAISIPAATNAVPGHATAAHIQAIEANTGKATNVSTTLSIGTKTATTLAVTSDGGADDVTLPAATATDAGLLTSTQYDKLLFSGRQTFEGVTSSDTILLTGSGKTTLKIRPSVDVKPQISQEKPTVCIHGATLGYCMPVFNDDDEEIYLSTFVPKRWDGTSDITAKLRVHLDTANTGKKFKMQLCWQHLKIGEVVTDSCNVVEVETDTGTAAQYKSFEIVFTLDYDIDGAGDEVKGDERLVARLRRIAASADEIAGEVVVAPLIYEFTRDRV